MIYVYAITCPHIGAAFKLVGLEGREVFFLHNDRIAAACSLHSGNPLLPTRENLWRQEQIAEALMAGGPMLPVRFATTFASEQDLRQTLDKHREALAEGLIRVQGCVELGLRVLWPLDEAAETSDETGALQLPACTAVTRDAPGRQYMLGRLADETQRRQRQVRAERFAEAIRRSLASLVRQQTERRLVTPRMLLMAAYLVERDRVEAIRERIRALGSQYPELRLLCTGPWPPYHFAPCLGR
jgi:hypothetical protein